MRKKTIVLLGLGKRGDEYDLFLTSLQNSGNWNIDIIPNEMINLKFYNHYLLK